MSESNVRIPDQIKMIPEFSGNSKETLTWISGTQEALEVFDFEFEPLELYKRIIEVVKSKIVGTAKVVLDAAGSPENWDDIKKVLLVVFDDTGDITWHLQSLFCIRQERISLNDYFEKLQSVELGIKSKAAQMDDFKDSINAVNKLISLVTLTRYIDGLNGDTLALYVRSCRPKTLEEAHKIATQRMNISLKRKMECMRVPECSLMQNVNETAASSRMDSEDDDLFFSDEVNAALEKAKKMKYL